MKYTTNLNLKKPDYIDGADIKDINDNMDSIDSAIATHLAEYAIQTATGTANVIAITTGGDFKYTQGNKISFKAIANSTAAVTINIDGKGAKALKKLDGTNATVKANKVYEIYYSVSDNCFFQLARAEGNVIAENVLAGKTFSNDDDVGIIGTMPNRTGNVTGQGVSRSGSTVRIQPQEGYYSGASGNSVQFAEPNLIASNIVSGVSIFGLNGSFNGKKWAQGNIGTLNSGATTTVSGLDFIPKIIILGYSTSGSPSMFYGSFNGYYRRGDGSVSGFIKGSSTYVNAEPTSNQFIVKTDWNVINLGWIAIE